MNQKIRGAFVAIGIIGFAVLIYIVIAMGVTNFDTTICNAFYSARTPGLTTLAEAITYLGNWEAIVIICLLLLIYPKTRIKFGLPVAGVAVVTSVTKIIVKPIVERARPDVVWHLITENGYSFPSGHSITSFAVYGLLFILILRYVEDKQKKIGLAIVCGALTFLVGLSRIYVGVHYPTDVLAGWCFALACIAGALMIIDWMNAKGITQKLEEKF